MSRKSSSCVLKADSSCALKNLNNNSFTLNLNDTSLTGSTVFKADIYNFFVGNALNAVHYDKRAVDFLYAYIIYYHLCVSSLFE